MPEHRWYNAGFQKAWVEWGKVEWGMEKKTSLAKNTEWEMCFYYSRCTEAQTGTMTYGACSEEEFSNVRLVFCGGLY